MAHSASRKGFGYRDGVLSFLVVLGLALPFIPVPGDRMGRMAVRFRTGGMAEPTSFVTRASQSMCRTVAAVMAFEDPARGEYARIECGPRRAQDPASRDGKMVGARGIEPLTPTMSR